MNELHDIVLAPISVADLRGFEASGVPDNPADVPDIYVDSMRVTVTPFGANVTFALSDPHPASGGLPSIGTDQVRLRMSLQHAKMVAMLLRKQLKLYEDKFGATIMLPQEIYAQLGLPKEDW